MGTSLNQISTITKSKTPKPWNSPMKNLPSVRLYRKWRKRNEATASIHKFHDAWTDSPEPTTTLLTFEGVFRFLFFFSPTKIPLRNKIQNVPFISSQQLSHQTNTNKTHHYESTTETDKPNDQNALRKGNKKQKQTWVTSAEVTHITTTAAIKNKPALYFQLIMNRTRPTMRNRRNNLRSMWVPSDLRGLWFSH